MKTFLALLATTVLVGGVSAYQRDHAEALPSAADGLRSMAAVYAAVASDNLTSLRMHGSFGYEEVSQVPGVWTVKFDQGEGILFRIEVK